MPLGYPTDAEIERARRRVDQDPDTTRHRVRLAELLRQAGRTAESADAYRLAARAYAVQADWLKAFAIARALLHLDPADAETQRFVTSAYSQARAHPKPGGAHDGREISTRPSPIESPAPLALPTKDRLPLDTTRFGELRSMDLLSDLGDGELEEISHQLRTLIVERGETIFREGEVSTGMFIVLRGQVHVAVSDVTGTMTPLVDLGQGEFFGEFAMMGSPHRQALVTAASRVELLDVDCELFDLLSERGARFCRALIDARSLRRRQNVLARSGLSGILGEEDRARVVDALREREVMPRELVLRAGDPVDRVYLVCSGRVEVYRRDRGGDKTLLTVVGPGMFVPDPEVVSGERYQVHARALEQTRVVVAPRELLQEIVDGDAEARARFVRLFSRLDAPTGTADGARTISVEREVIDLSDGDLDRI